MSATSTACRMTPRTITDAPVYVGVWASSRAVSEGHRISAWCSVIPIHDEPVTVRAWVKPPDPYKPVILHGPNAFRLESGPFAQLAAGARMQDATLFRDVTCRGTEWPEGVWDIGVSATFHDSGGEASDVTHFEVRPHKQAVSVLLDQVARLRKELALAIGDPDFRFDNSNSEHISASEVVAALQNAWPDMSASTIQISDGTYRAPTRQALAYAVASAGIHRREYISGSHDCDDFAYAAQGLLSDPRYSEAPSGPLWGKRSKPPTMNHAVDHCVLKERLDNGHRAVVIIEPQTAQLHSPRDLDRPGDPWVPYVCLV